MEKKVIFVVSVFIGVVFVVLLTKAKDKIVENASNKEEPMEIVTCISEMDSATLRLEQDSVVRFGNKLCCEDLYIYYMHILCGLYDNAFYSMVMVNKYDDKDSYSRIFQLEDDFSGRLI